MEKEQLNLLNYTQQIKKKSKIISDLVDDYKILYCPQCNCIIADINNGSNLEETECKNCHLKMETAGNCLHIWKEEKKKTKAEQAIEKYGSSLSCLDSKIIAEGDYLKIPLPRANSTWIFRAYEYAKRIKEDCYASGDIYGYPVYFPENDNTKYLYIKME